MADLKTVVAVQQLFDFLEPPNVASLSYATPADAPGIIAVIQRRVKAATGPITDRDQLANAYLKVLRAAEPRTIAVDLGVGLSEVRRILITMEQGVKFFLGHNGQPPSFFSALQPYVSAQRYLSTALWPQQSLEDHTIALRDAIDEVRQNSVALDLHTGLVPRQDLEIIHHGAALLAKKVANVYGTFKQMAQKVQTAATDAASVSGEDLKGTETQRPAIGPFTVQPGVQRSPHLRIENGTAQPIVPAASTSIAQPPVPTFAAPCLPKHALPRSRGTSPVRKKTRTNILDNLRNDKLNAYVLFVLAEQSRLEQQFPNVRGVALSELLATLWADLTLDEQAPYEAVCHEFSRREKELSDGDVNADADERRKRLVVMREERVRKISRCWTLRGATGVVEWSKTKAKKIVAPEEQTASDMPAVSEALPTVASTAAEISALVDVPEPQTKASSLPVQTTEPIIPLQVNQSTVLPQQAEEHSTPSQTTEPSTALPVPEAVLPKTSLPQLSKPTSPTVPKSPSRPTDSISTTVIAAKATAAQQHPPSPPPYSDLSTVPSDIDDTTDVEDNQKAIAAKLARISNIHVDMDWEEIYRLLEGKAKGK
ncbi:hypothetical protein CC86DRAFT_25490 [Ophiobolus disseminans]|uniref:HMG box domain-containing protein n=1 Tax=Ophiobolus disseminans TaxID=1469910 RepID=A0A6A6ZZ49_9PLEO|nr:hypothetical protein CC86DRAFT_25490 [Ophiobolus disseminans]